MKPSAPPHAATPAMTGRESPLAPSEKSWSRVALVRELRLHQVELEQQNEQLRAAQRELAIAHDRYVGLFDHAPVGYLTLDRDGRVTEANLTAATEFGVARHAMLGNPFHHFVVPADCDRWQRLHALAMRRADPRRIELRLRRHDGQPFHAQLDCLRVRNPGARVQLRVTITDVSQRKLAERNRGIAVTGNLAREAERRRIAHGLHEDLGQRLCALQMMLATLQSPALPPSSRATVGAMAAQLGEALVVVRRMTGELHPLILDNLGLAAAMELLLTDVAARLGVEVELQADEAARVDEASTIAIYRLAEALLEQVSRQVTAAVTMELLQRPHDLVLRFRCDPVRERPEGSPAAIVEIPGAVWDQVHLLAGRVELDEPAPGACRISIFLPNAAPAVA